MVSRLLDPSFKLTAEDRVAFLKRLAAENRIIQIREIPGDWWAGIQKFAFTWAIISGRMFDEVSVENRWCYHTLEDAAVAFEAWGGTGDPDGWHRHPPSGRRRWPDGTEEVRD